MTIVEQIELLKITQIILRLNVDFILFDVHIFLRTFLVPTMIHIIQYDAIYEYTTFVHSFHFYIISVNFLS